MIKLDDESPSGNFLAWRELIKGYGRKNKLACHFQSTLIHSVLVIRTKCYGRSWKGRLIQILPCGNRVEGHAERMWADVKETGNI